MFYLYLHTYNQHTLQQKHAKARLDKKPTQRPQSLKIYPLFTTDLV